MTYPLLAGAIQNTFTAGLLTRFYEHCAFPTRQHSRKLYRAKVSGIVQHPPSAYKAEGKTYSSEHCFGFSPNSLLIPSVKRGNRLSANIIRNSQDYKKSFCFVSFFHTNSLFSRKNK
jgi:hypothetical protein